MAHAQQPANLVDNNFGNDLNDIEDMEVDQEVNEEDLQQPNPPAKGSGNNKEAEILDIDDIPEFE